MSFQFNLGVQFKQNSAPTNKVYGDRWYDTINEECFEWTEASPDSWTSCIPIGDNAYIVGGLQSTTYLDEIESFDFPFSAAAAVVGNLSASVRMVQAMNSTTYGFVTGGYTAASTRTSSIDRLSFPFAGTPAAFSGKLSVLSGHGTACNSSDYGYVMCGDRYDTGVEASTIERITFPFDSGDGVDQGAIVSSGSGNSDLAAFNSSTHGYIALGRRSSTRDSMLHRFEFPFDFADAYLTGDTGSTRRDFCACNSSEHGYVMGGDASSSWSSIFRMQFPFADGSAVLVGDLGPSRDESAGINSSLQGFVVAGGGVGTERLDSRRFDFPFDSGSVAVAGDLTQAREATTGLDETDFIEIFTEDPTPDTATNFGFTVGGSNKTVNQTYYDLIQRLSFPFDSGIANTVGNLTSTQRWETCGFNSTTHGYIATGLRTNSFAISVIDRFQFPFDGGEATALGGVSKSRARPAGVNSSKHGYVVGGRSGTSAVTNIDRIEFPFDSGDAVLIGLTASQANNEYNPTGCNSSTHAHIVGGLSNTSYGDNIGRFQFAYEGVVCQVIGLMSGSFHRAAGCNSSTHGFFMGGSQHAKAVERLTFPFLSGPSQDIGNINGTTMDAAGFNSTIYGFAVGGTTSNSYLQAVNIVNRMVFPFASGTMVEVGSLVTPLMSSAGVDNTDFILRFTDPDDTPSGSVFMYVAGGSHDAWTSSYAMSNVERYEFPFNSGIARTLGNLSGTRYTCAGCNSTIHGYVSGGTVAATKRSTIDRLTFPFSSGDATVVGSLAASRFYCSSWNSSTHGYVVGDNQIINVYTIAFPFDSGTAELTHRRSDATQAAAGINNSYFGYCTGGATSGTSGGRKEVLRMQFPINGSAMVEMGSLAYTRVQHAGCNDSNYGYLAGGYNGSSLFQSSIERLQWNFEGGTGVIAGDLNQSRRGCVAGNNDVAGLITCGGKNSGEDPHFPITKTEKIDFPWSGGTATIAGGIEIPRQLPAGLDNGDFKVLFAPFTDLPDGSGNSFGIIFGGFSGSSLYLDMIARLVFPFSSGISKDLGGLTVPRTDCTACNSSQYGYCMFGFGASPGGAVSRQTTIERIQFPFDSGSPTSVGMSSVDVTRRSCAGCNSSQHGFAVNGYNGGSSASSIVDRITFPFDSGTATQRTDASGLSSLSGRASCNDTNYGYVFGGLFGAAYSKISERISFPFDSGGVLDMTSLSTTRRWAAGCNSSTHGFIIAGQSSASILSTIERIVFPFSNGSYSDGGGINQSRKQHCSYNSTSYGYVSGGFNDSGTDYYIGSHERFAFNFDSGTATVVGEASTLFSQASATDNVDFVGLFV